MTGQQVARIILTALEQVADTYRMSGVATDYEIGEALHKVSARIEVELARHGIIERVAE